MRCLKCGVHVGQNQVFCEPCQGEMKKYPVSRETPAVIFPRPKPAPARSRVIKPEELLLAAKKKQKRLRWVCAVFITLSLILGGILLYNLTREDSLPIGQNYKSNTSQTADTTQGNRP